MVHCTHPADDWHPGMPCASTEEFWFTSQNNGPAIAKFVGDRAVISPAYQFWSGPGHVVGQTLHRRVPRHGCQRLGVYAHNFLGLAMQAVTFNMPQQEIRYYSGAKFDRRLTIHDDEFAPGKLEFTWKLLDSDGREFIAKPGNSIPTRRSSSANG